MGLRSLKKNCSNQMTNPPKWSFKWFFKSRMHNFLFVDKWDEWNWYKRHLRCGMPYNCHSTTTTTPQHLSCFPIFYRCFLCWNFGACLKRWLVYEASRPRSLTAKINFGYMSTIVYNRGLRPKFLCCQILWNGSTYNILSNTRVYFSLFVFSTLV